MEFSTFPKFGSRRELEAHANNEHVPLEAVTNSLNHILISCKLTEICQFVFGIVAKFQGHMVKIHFLAHIP